MTFQASSKRLNDGSSHCATPSLGLHVDSIQAELVFLDDSIDAAVPASAHNLASLFCRTTIAHRNQKFYHESADVFEWLKKTKRLATVLDGKDESAIFDLANNFAIRHHNPTQKTNYDCAIWYSWIFHFYLATYHAAVRLLIKKERNSKGPATRG